MKENYLFYFREDEFTKLFPKEVVEWMINNPRAILPGIYPDGKRQRDREEPKGKDFYPLPGPGDLPVIAATRMSLSFPVLLSVIPLYSIDYSKWEEHPTLERCWFTDGGVCSNFPIHFLDAPLPRRSTFSIDLINKPIDSSPSDLNPEMDLTNGFDLI